jgi:hypothetical protein
VINSNRLILKRMGMFGQDRTETSGSSIEQMLPKCIHAVTAAGFELKSVLVVPALSIGFLKVETWVTIARGARKQDLEHEVKSI